MNRRASFRPDLWVLLSLTAAILMVYGRVGDFDFINFDDPGYILGNPNVKAGLTLKGLKWAFTTQHLANWHPLTWLSHMLDCQLFGVDARAHHWMNVTFHIGNTILLFGLLKRMTGAVWRSAFVAGLFALHPLHVESVAWISERKDVLSTTFWMLTLWAYVHYVEQRRLHHYLLALFFFALALMAKPMPVTLPFVLLLLDYWPLGRWQRVAGLVAEKIPFFALAAVMSVVTYCVQKGSGATSLLVTTTPLALRIGNALTSYVGHIGKMIWPTKLAVFYPYPETLPVWKVAAAAAILVLISVVVVRAATRHPFLLVGWLWYLGTLVPVIGLVQVGRQSMADRFTYVPLIGLFITVAWGVPELVARWRYPRTVLAMAVGGSIGACMIVSWLQLQHWRNSITLFEHALRVTNKNYVAHSSLAVALAGQDKIDAAVAQYNDALRIRPEFEYALTGMAALVAHQGRTDEAIALFTEALRAKPDFVHAHHRLAATLAGIGRLEAAVTHLRIATRLKPDSPEPLNDLAKLLIANPRLSHRDAIEAVELAQRACELTGNDQPAMLLTLAAAYAEARRFPEAAETAHQAFDLAVRYGLTELAIESRARLREYQSAQP